MTHWGPRVRKNLKKKKKDNLDLDSEKFIFFYRSQGCTILRKSYFELKNSLSKNQVASGNFSDTLRVYHQRLHAKKFCRQVSKFVWNRLHIKMVWQLFYTPFHFSQGNPVTFASFFISASNAEMLQMFFHFCNLQASALECFLFLGVLYSVPVFIGVKLRSPEQRRPSTRLNFTETVTLIAKKQMDAHNILRC